MKKFLYLPLISIFIFGCGSEEKTQDTSAALKVKVNTVQPQSTAETYSFSGKVMSNHAVNISTKLMGRIEYLPVEEGEQIREGQPLVRISNDELLAKKSSVEANLSEAKAQLQKVQKDYERITNLFDKGSATEKEKDDISYALEASKAKVNALKSSIAEVNDLLTYASINAPFNGFVTKKFMETGDLANPGMPIMTIESLSDFKVITKIPESELSLVHQNDEVNVYIQSLDKNVKGIITQINPSSLSGNLQFEATIKLKEKAESSIKSGMYAEVQISKDTEEKLLLPKDAIMKKGQLSGVYTVNNQNKTTLRWLRLGKEYDGKVEVLSGLIEGESYIMPGNQKLHSGLTVQVEK